MQQRDPTLILYATREGQAEKVANRIAEHLRERRRSVEVVDARDTEATAQLNLDHYDLLVFGGSMHAGGIESELVEFINERRDQIVKKPTSFFLVLLSAATKDPDLRQQWLADARKKMDEQFSIAFDDIEMVAGALRYSQYSLPVKWLMKRIAGQAGEGTDTRRDYEYTDWERVEAYAERLTKRR